MLAPLPGPLDAGQVREVFGRVVGAVDRASGPGFSARSVVAILPDGTRRAVAVPSQADLDAARAQREQPAPAPGQVWLPPPSAAAPSWVDADGTVTIASDDTLGVPGLLWLVHGGAIDVSDLRGWACVGVATPHGRVMVGDGFAAPSGIQVEVMGVGPDDLLVWGSREPHRERFTPGHTEAATLLGWTRTRYAPARAGERFRAGGGYCDDWTIDAYDVGRVFDAAAYERLDPGQGAGPRVYAALKVSVNGRELRDVTEAHGLDTATGAALDALAATMGIERRAAVQPSGTVGPAIYTLPDLANQARTLTLAPGSRLTPLGDGRTYRIEPEPERPALTLQAPASDLRALFDAIGRALELPATRHVCAFGEGLTVTVLRDEMLFTPTAQTCLGTADLAADARGLQALRAALQDAMAHGAASLPQWGAKGPCVEVQREGGAAVADVAHEASEAPRYTPSEGGAGAWRWETGK